MSRLTQAWLVFAAVCSALAVYTLSDDARRRAAIAMTVEGVERLAPPADDRRAAGARIDKQDFSREARAVSPSSAAFDLDTQDALGGIEADGPTAADPAADIVITVDGEPARPIAATSALGSLTVQRIAAPDAALLQQTAFGRAPRIGADGRRPSKVYARPYAPDEAPAVALIVGGLGLNRAVTERAITELPANVTLAFAPYAKDLDHWARRAREAGHEFMIEIPMENRSGEGEALGPATLLTSRSAEENLQRLDWILSRAEGYFGVTNYLGAHFSADRESILPVLDRIAAAGVAYFDDTGAVKPRKGAALATVSRLIDPGFGGDKGRAARDLDSLEKMAARNGQAVGKTYVNADTLGTLVDWAETLSARGLALAPASAMLANRGEDS